MFNGRFLAEEPPTFKDKDGFEYYMCGLCSAYPQVIYNDLQGTAHITCHRCHPDREFSLVSWNCFNQQSRDRMTYTSQLEKEINSLYDRLHIILTHCGEALRG
jgi:hypothetical protein